MNRRRFLAGSTAALAGATGGLGLRGGAAALPTAAPAAPFDPLLVRRKARELAAAEFKPPDKSLPKELQNLEYDAYRALRFRPERALWRGEGLPFEAQFFHRGFIFTDRVDLYEVSEGYARPIAYSPDLFEFGQIKFPAEADLGFAGFRLHGPINRADYYDEVGVFLGASYFRAVARNQVYGLSARGLSIATGDPKGEEFPVFRTFWIEKPDKHVSSIVVYGLLDSKSTTGAFRFDIRPGRTTVYDIEAALYPRVDLAKVGIGTLTSMFLFGANDRADVDDFRPAVHDSDGLAIRNGRGEEIWRPLSNPRDLQISVFTDDNPRGFGLFQRERRFHAYEDIESRYEKRPSAWVEPMTGWGQGGVHLVEIPSREEIHDNIVAFWRPRATLRGGREYEFRYRLRWGYEDTDSGALARFVKTRVGAGPGDSRRFVLDVDGSTLHGIDPQTVRATVSADKGEIRNLVVHGHPVTGGLRVSFELVPKKEPLVELRAQLTRNDKPISEVWIYRWTA